MSTTLIRWRSDISLAWGPEGIPDALWEVLLAIAREGGEEVSTAAIARRLGVSSERTARLLPRIPESVMPSARRGRHVVWSLALGPSAEVPAHALDAALRELATHPSRRRGDGDRAASASAQVGRAHTLLARRGPIACARFIRETNLHPAVVLASTSSSTARQRLACELALLHADLAMNQGRARKAVAIARRGLARAEGEHETQFRLHMVSGAAARMVSPESLPESLQHFVRAAHLAAALTPTRRKHAMRWALASQATPLVAMDRLAEAELVAGRAWSMGSAEDPMGIAESTLLLSRPLLWQGQVERASQLCESVNQSSGWIYGWLLRYRADILRGSMSPLEQWFLTLRDAWRANMGYLFQQKLLLARILTIDIKILLAPSTRGLLDHYHWQRAELTENDLGCPRKVAPVAGGKAGWVPPGIPSTCLATPYPPSGVDGAPGRKARHPQCWSRGSRQWWHSPTAGRTIRQGTRPRLSTIQRRQPHVPTGFVWCFNGLRTPG